MPDGVGCVYFTYFTERSCLENSKPEIPTPLSKMNCAAIRGNWICVRTPRNSQLLLVVEMIVPCFVQGGCLRPEFGDFHGK